MPTGRRVFNAELYIYIYIYIQMYTYMYIYIYTYICIYIYTYVYIVCCFISLSLSLSLFLSLSLSLSLSFYLSFSLPLFTYIVPISKKKQMPRLWDGFPSPLHATGKFLPGFRVFSGLNPYAGCIGSLTTPKQVTHATQGSDACRC